MTAHTGMYGCITCEEMGVGVRQGKGHARYYPYRENAERPSNRTSGEFCSDAQSATASKRVKGTMGISGLSFLPKFDMVKGLVPDYMHGVLLGITKTLLYKWFSSTNSKKDFFLGKKIKAISHRLQGIKPPDYVVRLPRDIEKHYMHFKANELQSWLLHYALPCLQGFLPDKYLEHFACLSEGIYLLLSDNITGSDLQRAESLLNICFTRNIPTSMEQEAVD